MNKRLFLVITGIGIAALLVVSYITDRRHIKQKALEQLDKSTLSDNISKATKPIDTESGLVIDPGFNLVKTNCLRCHSSKLITQNKANRETWKETIRWMQKTQNLWDLGENESKILDYLAKNYAPGQMGRRLPLRDVQWYELQE